MTKNKKATINPKNNDDKCFQYAVTVALYYEQIKYHPERTSNIKPFTDKCNWKKIFHHIVKIAKYLSQTVNQLPLIVSMCLIILKI